MASPGDWDLKCRRANSSSASFTSVIRGRFSGSYTKTLCCFCRHKQLSCRDPASHHPIALTAGLLHVIVLHKLCCVGCQVCMKHSLHDKYILSVVELHYSLPADADDSSVCVSFHLLAEAHRIWQGHHCFTVLMCMRTASLHASNECIASNISGMCKCNLAQHH